MRYILAPGAACIAFIVVYIWEFDYKAAKKEFLDIIKPDKFHYYE